MNNGGQEALPNPTVVEEGQAASAGLEQSQAEAPSSFLPGVSPFQLTLETQQPMASVVILDGPAEPLQLQAPATDLSQLTEDSQQ